MGVFIFLNSLHRCPLDDLQPVSRCLAPCSGRLLKLCVGVGIIFDVPLLARLSAEAGLSEVALVLDFHDHLKHCLVQFLLGLALRLLGGAAVWDLKRSTTKHGQRLMLHNCRGLFLGESSRAFGQVRAPFSFVKASAAEGLQQMALDKSNAREQSDRVTEVFLEVIPRGLFATHAAVKCCKTAAFIS